MDIADMLRLRVEREIKAGGHPSPEDLAELLRENDITPEIGQYVADYFVDKCKQRLVGSKKSTLTDSQKRPFVLWLVNEAIEDAAKNGETITKTKAIHRAANHAKELGLKGFSRTAIYAILKPLK